MTSTTVSLFGKAHPLEMPRRFAERQELVSAWVNNKMRGSAALIGVCVPSLDLGPSLVMCDFNVYEYGAQCLDVLKSRGLADVEIMAAAVPMFNALAEGLFPSAVEVDKSVDFTNQREAG